MSRLWLAPRAIPSLVTDGFRGAQVTRHFPDGIRSDSRSEHRCLESFPFGGTSEDRGALWVATALSGRSMEPGHSTSR